MIRCDCSVVGHDPADVLAERMVKARASHECCECGEKIKPGDTYEKVDGCWEGHWSHYQTCEPCWKIRQTYCPTGWIYGMLRETIWECLEFDYVTGESRCWECWTTLAHEDMVCTKCGTPAFSWQEDEEPTDTETSG
jgi:hypothetical protein